MRNFFWICKAIKELPTNFENFRFKELLLYWAKFLFPSEFVETSVYCKLVLALGQLWNKQTSRGDLNYYVEILDLNFSKRSGIFTKCSLQVFLEHVLWWLRRNRGDLQISKNQLLEKSHSSVNTLEIFVLMICYEIFPALKKYIIYRATPMWETTFYLQRTEAIVVICTLINTLVYSLW